MFVQALLGPMGSGKTTELLRLACCEGVIPVAVKHVADDARYGPGLRAHDGRTTSAISVTKLQSPTVYCAVRSTTRVDLFSHDPSQCYVFTSGAVRVEARGRTGRHRARARGRDAVLRRR